MLRIFARARRSSSSGIVVSCDNIVFIAQAWLARIGTPSKQRGALTARLKA